MKTIYVTTVLDSTCLLTSEKGQELLNVIENSLKNSPSLIINFKGANFLSSSFLNNSFGQLVLNRNWDFDTFKEHIQIICLDLDDLEEVELAVYNALSRRDLFDKGIDPKEFYAQHLTY